MKKFLFVLALIFCFSCVAIAYESKKASKDDNDGYCAEYKESLGKMGGAYPTYWYQITQMNNNGSAGMRIIFENGDYITTFDPVQTSIASMAFANNLNVIVHWTSHTSWDMLYVGK